MPKTSNNAYGSYSPALYKVIRETLHRIGDIDHQLEAEIHEVERATPDEELKNYIKQKIQIAYQKRRQPYVDLLTTLRLTQQR